MRSSTKFFLLNEWFRPVPVSLFLACLQELVNTEQLLQSSTSTISRYEGSIATLSDHVDGLFLVHAQSVETFRVEKEQLEQIIEQLNNHISKMTQERFEANQNEPEMAGDDSPASFRRSLKFFPLFSNDSGKFRRIAILQSNEILLTRKLNVLEKALVTLESVGSIGLPPQLPDLGCSVKFAVAMTGSTLSGSYKRESPNSSTPSPNPHPPLALYRSNLMNPSPTISMNLSSLDATCSTKSRFLLLTPASL